MCGICGIFDPGGSSSGDAVGRMRQALSHRGPDDEGYYEDGPVALGFRRLSILDVSGGHQPMVTEDGDVALVFNGEIYNHPELRAQLEARGARFKTRSDTETVLRLYAAQGAAAFASLNGMFSLAVWDRKRGELILSRDPIGIKPLYYSWDGRALRFSSELRALLAGGLDDALDPDGVVDYLVYGKVHGPRTILRGARKLPAGHWLRLGINGLKIEPYWRLTKTPADSSESLEESVEHLDKLLSESVKGAMLSDVPLGAFLSGGVDSSLIAAYMVRHSGSAKVKTFSVGFKGANAGVDESAYARRAAAHLGTDHQELILPAGILEKLEQSIELLDEPIADSAILPTFLLSQFARKSVKVVLTGEGADELFAGYGRYKAAWLNEKLNGLPAWGRSLAAPLARRLGKGRVFDALPVSSLRQWAEATASCAPGQLAPILHPDFSGACDGGASTLQEPLSLNDILAFELKTVLCDSLLMKVDKSTMRASLEARVPFLNKPVVEYAAGLPASFKMRHFKGKYLLRLVAQKYLPRDIVWRRKHGFIVPWEAWVRSPNNAAIAALLADESFRSLHLFDMGRLNRLHQELVRGDSSADAGLFFRVVVLGLWLKSLKSQKALC